MPLKERAKVYVPKRFIREYRDFFGHIQGNEWVDPVDRSVLEQYFDVADTPEDADAALVVIMAPESEGYNDEDREKGGNGYMPISLQYRP